MNDVLSTTMTSSRKLTVQFLESISDLRPPPYSLFWKMWDNSKDFAEKSLNTSYIQGIQNGTLSPEKYGWSVVNDSYYCFRGADDYGEAAKRTTDPDLKDYLQKKEKRLCEKVAHQRCFKCCSNPGMFINTYSKAFINIQFPLILLAC